MKIKAVLARPRLLAHPLDLQRRLALLFSHALLVGVFVCKKPAATISATRGRRSCPPPNSRRTRHYSVHYTPRAATGPSWSGRQTPADHIPEAPAQPSATTARPARELRHRADPGTGPP